MLIWEIHVPTCLSNREFVEATTFVLRLDCFVNVSKHPLNEALFLVHRYCYTLCEDLKLADHPASIDMSANQNCNCHFIYGTDGSSFVCE